MSERQSIRNRLILVFSFLLLFMGLIVGTFFLQERKINQWGWFSEQLHNLYHGLLDAQNLEKEMCIRKNLDTSPEREMSEVVSDHQYLMTQLGHEIDVLKNQLSEVSLSKAHYTDTLLYYLASYKESFSLLENTKNVRDPEYHRRIAETGESMQKMEHSITLLQEELDHKEQTIKNILHIVLITVSILVVILAVYFVFLMFSRVIYPLKYLNNTIKKIISSGFSTSSYEFKPIHSNDEMGEISENFSLMLESIEQQNNEITQQKDEIVNKQEKIKSSEEKHRMLVENLKNVIFSIDKKLIFSYISPSVENLLQYDPNEILNQPFVSLMHEEDKQYIYEKLINYIEQGTQPGVNEVRLVKKSGDLLWVSIHLKRMKEGNDVTGIQGVISNIQERKKVEERVNMANAKIMEQQQSITDSIYYARRIQQAILPRDAFIKKVLPEHFVLYIPKDIVSGDFYWVVRKAATVLIAVGDCTGHGVPGAFMSMLGVSLLNDALSKNLKKFFEGDLKASDMLEELRKRVKKSLRQSSEDSLSKDGMDMAFCILDYDTNLLQYAGAFNPLYIIRKGELIKVKATRNPVGIYIKEQAFENHEIQLQEGDRLYMFSDGYIDQFGGENDVKFLTKNFQKLLLDIYDKPMNQQKQILKDTFHNWKGDFDQVDDIVVMGFRV